jgi:hypothetical protein
MLLLERTGAVVARADGRCGWLKTYSLGVARMRTVTAVYIFLVLQPGGCKTEHTPKAFLWCESLSFGQINEV